MLDPGNVVEDRMLGVLPFFHVFANTVVLNRTIFNGGEIIMLPRFDAVQTLAAVARTRPTALPGVPTMYQALRSEEHTSELQSLMRISYAVFCLKKKKQEI